MATRTYQHIIDTKAIKSVLNTIPDYWVVRELSERDYGVDLVIEVFDYKEQDKNDHEKYSTSGCTLNIQVKGTATKIKPNSDDKICFSFPRSKLISYEKYAIPVVLFRVDVSEGKTGDIYFAWIQKYIKMQLDRDEPEWRYEDRYNSEDKLIEDPAYKIKIPLENIVNEQLGKLEFIAKRIKFIEELSEFIELFKEIKEILDDVAGGHCYLDEDILKEMIFKTKQIQRLSVLLRLNRCQVNEQQVSDFLKHLIIYIGVTDYTGIEDYPHREDLLRLLEIENRTIIEIDEMMADICGEYSY